MKNSSVKNGVVLLAFSLSIVFSACSKDPNPYQTVVTTQPTNPIVQPTAAINNLPTGIVTGQVMDYTTNTSIAGAKVEILGLRPAVSAITDANGKFTLNNVPQGRQVLTVTKANYTRATSSNIVVDVKAGTTVTSSQISLLSTNNSSSNSFVKSFDGFKLPRGLSADRTSGQIYVVDVIGAGGLITFDRAEIKKIDSDGGIVDSFGSRILNSDLSKIDIFRLLKKANGIGVDAGGNVYVADTGNSVVKKYGPTGKYLSEIKKDFKNVYDVAVTTTGDVIVSDPGSSRVILMDSSLNVRVDNLLKDSPSDGIRGLATDNGDNIYIIDASAVQGQVIKKFDKYGNRLPLQFGRLGTLEAGSFNNPTDLAVDPKSGDIYVVDSGNNRVQRFSADGNYLSEFGQFGSDNGSFNNPWGIAIDASGFVYVSDSQNARVQKFMPGRVLAN